MFDGVFQPMHLLIVLVIAFFLFGAKRLPELGKALGTSIREFKKGVSELHTDADDERPAPATMAPPALTAPATPAAAASTVQTSNEPADVADE